VKTNPLDRSFIEEELKQAALALTSKVILVVLTETYHCHEVIPVLVVVEVLLDPEDEPEELPLVDPEVDPDVDPLWSGGKMNGLLALPEVELDELDPVDDELLDGVTAACSLLLLVEEVEAVVAAGWVLH